MKNLKKVLVATALVLVFVGTAERSYADGGAATVPILTVTGVPAAPAIAVITGAAAVNEVIKNNTGKNNEIRKGGRALDEKLIQKPKKALKKVFKKVFGW